MTRRLVTSLVIGLVVGVAVAFAAGAVFDGVGAVGTVGFWGYVSGAAAGLVALTASLAVRSRGSRGRRAALYSLACSLALVGLALLWWNIMWGYPPLSSPEGQWMWPLMVLTVVGALLALRQGSSRHERREPVGRRHDED